MFSKMLKVLAIAHVVVSAFLVQEYTGENVEDSSEENNSTDCNFLTESPEDLPQGIDMDTITIIWYLSTFVALVAFFVVMACSDNYCGRPRKPEEPPMTAPPTPAPSYREFAPPSYDSVMKRYKNRVFIIPVSDSNTDQTTQVQDVTVHPTDDQRIVIDTPQDSSQAQIERF